MKNESSLQRYVPTVLWIIALAAIYFTLNSLIAPFASGITLNGKIISESSKQLAGFLLGIIGGLALIEIYFYQIFFRKPKNAATTVVIRALQIILAVLMLMVIISFLETTDLFRMGNSGIGNFLRSPVTTFTGLKSTLVKSHIATKDSVQFTLGGMLALVLLIIFAIIHFTSVPRSHHYGLAYLLVLPALLGVLFLIVYPFLFEIKLAFSNASLGTQATKNAAYGLQYGWDNLKNLIHWNSCQRCQVPGCVLAHHSLDRNQRDISRCWRYGTCHPIKSSDEGTGFLPDVTCLPVGDSHYHRSYGTTQRV